MRTYNISALVLVSLLATNSFAKECPKNDQEWSKIKSNAYRLKLNHLTLQCRDLTDRGNKSYSKFHSFFSKAWDDSQPILAKAWGRKNVDKHGVAEDYATRNLNLLSLQSARGTQDQNNANCEMLRSELDFLESANVSDDAALVAHIMASPMSKEHGLAACDASGAIAGAEIKSTELPSPANPLAYGALLNLAAMYKSCEAANAGADLSALGDKLDVKPGYSWTYHLPKFSKLTPNVYEMSYKDSSWDCTGFLAGAIALSGLRVKRGRNLSEALDIDSIHSWGKNADDCFAPVSLDGKKPALAEGDILVAPGHVSLISHVSNPKDPLGIDEYLRKSGNQCGKDLEESVMRFLNKNPIYVVDNFGVSRSFNSGIDIDAVVKKECEAKTKSQPALLVLGDEVYQDKVLRHSGGPGCISNEKIVPPNIEIAGKCKNVQMLDPTQAASTWAAFLSRDNSTGDSPVNTSNGPKDQGVDPSAPGSEDGSGSQKVN